VAILTYCEWNLSIWQLWALTPRTKPLGRATKRRNNNLIPTKFRRKTVDSVNQHGTLMLAD
jgi:hypothetical protein